ncbi:cytochrome P450 [Streptomyces sp. SID3343]|uniref:cytochrome P450 n=1 Tax=Streptomyces sp. SID3343 TaxID=2690260 RepID=UPI00136E4962|nr:cytochrome P450 [Streptomyces sp. SID3343]MYW00342.1 cytochrome P450 [Streptomyces sp. SID3343]
MTTTPATARPTLDLLDGDWYANDPYADYAWFREHEPVAWDAGNELWGIFRHFDLKDVEARSEHFVNSDRKKGGYRPNLPADPAIIGLDNPLHNQRRKLVSKWFTPRGVREWEAHVRETCVEILDAAVAKGTVEVVGDLASVLPAKMIGRLLGFPDDDWPKLRDWSERTIALGGGPRYFSADGKAAATEFITSALGLYESKKACPADDVMSVWTKARIDGEPVGPGDVASDCLLLLDGGAETTRTVIARTFLYLIEHPDQWDLLRAGADLAVATEEFIRYTTPIHNMCRVAVGDQRVGDTVIPDGHQVVLMYASANRDTAVFAEPERFDVTRTPNDHITFGFGTHFCLGAPLARLEIRVFFEELLKRVRAIRLVPGSAVEQMPNAFVYGIRAAHVELIR